METVLSVAASQDNSNTDEEGPSKSSNHGSEDEGSSEVQQNGDYNKNNEPKVIRIRPLNVDKPVSDESESEKPSSSIDNSEIDEDEPSEEENEELDAEPHEDLEEDLEAFSDLPPNASLHAADEMKKRLEEIDPCEKLRSLCKKGEVEVRTFWIGL